VGLDPGTNPLIEETVMEEAVMIAFAVPYMVEYVILDTATVLPDKVEN